MLPLEVDLPAAPITARDGERAEVEQDGAGGVGAGVHALSNNSLICCITYSRGKT